MSFDFSSLEPHIHKILTAPGTDLSRISAKGVRQKLIRTVPELSPEFVKENKDHLDTVIAGVYASVTGIGEASDNADDAEKEEISDVPSGDESHEARKRKHGSDEEEDEPRAKKAKKGASANGSAAKKGTRAKKNVAVVASDAESADEKKKKKKPKRKPAGEGSGAKGGFAKEFTLSYPLVQVVGVEKLSRPQVVKQLWVYIKENKLQNPENGKEILLDDKLKAVFGGDKIDMFAMNKALGQHLHKE